MARSMRAVTERAGSEPGPRMNQKQGDAARRPARDDDGGLLARFWRSYMKRHTRSYLAGGVFLLATTALTIAKIKAATGSNEPLLSDRGRSVLGVPLLVSSAVTAGTIYGIDSRFVQIVVRDNTRLEVDRSAYFATDQVGVKATMRVGFAFMHPGALVKITASA